MKAEGTWVEYLFIPSEKEGLFRICSRTNHWYTFSRLNGLFNEEQIKKILSRKQFNEWKSKKRNTFTKYLTVEERKQILKLNNKKKDAN